jgi:hypothetical protein
VGRRHPAAYDGSRFCLDPSPGKPAPRGRPPRRHRRPPTLTPGSRTPGFRRGFQPTGTAGGLRVCEPLSALHSVEPLNSSSLRPQALCLKRILNFRRILKYSSRGWAAGRGLSNAITPHVTPAVSCSPCKPLVGLGFSRNGAAVDATAALTARKVASTRVSRS